MLLRVEASGFGVQGLGFRVQNSGFGVWGMGLMEVSLGSFRLLYNMLLGRRYLPSSP